MFSIRKRMRYEYKRKPRKCPMCGSVRIASILYGYPAFSEELQKDMDEGRVVLGGCCVTDDDPVWECVDCSTEIFRKGNQNEFF